MFKDIKNDLMPALGILQSCGKIFYYAEGFVSPEDFYNHDEQAYFNASLALLTNIGELVSKLSDDFKTKYPNIDWINVKGLRNKIAHDYQGIDIVITYDIIREDLVILNKNLESAIASELSAHSFSREEYKLAKTSASDYFKYIDFTVIDMQLHE